MIVNDVVVSTVHCFNWCDFSQNFHDSGFVTSSKTF